MTLPICAAMPTRCSHGYDPVQAPIHTCRELVDLAKSRGIAAANDAAPDDVKARIDAAIRRWAAKGVEFSLNDVRPEFADVSGGIVGARVNAAARNGLIVDTDRQIPSTLPSTHGHKITVWRGAQAARWSA